MLKILVVDDEKIIRKGLVKKIDAMEKSYKVIGEAANGVEALELIEREKPDVAIVDLRLGKECGLEIVERAKKKVCSTKFIILTSSMRKEDFESYRIRESV